MELSTDQRLAGLGPVGVEIGRVMSETLIELADAYAARDHYKRSLDLVLDEMSALAKIVLNTKTDRRLVIRKTELDAVAADLILHVSIPEPGVKVYQLRRREDTTQPEATKIVLPEGHA